MSVFSRIAVGCCALGLTVGTVAMPTVAAAQTAGTTAPAEVFGDWLLRCAVNDAKRCALTQRIIHSETRAVVAEIGIAPLAAGADGFAIVLSVPAGADLGAAPAFRLDGAPDQTAMAWRVCVNAMCQASASISPAQVEEMEAAGRGIFGYKKYRASTVTLTAVSYDGLAAGLTAMGAK